MLGSRSLVSFKELAFKGNFLNWKSTYLGFAGKRGRSSDQNLVPSDLSKLKTHIRN